MEEGDVDLTGTVTDTIGTVSGGGDVGGDVINTLDTIRDVIEPIDLVEELAGGVVKEGDEETETTTVGHPNHDVLDTSLGSRTKDGVKSREEGVGALTRVALQRHVLLGEEELEGLSLLGSAALSQCSNSAPRGPQ